MPEVILIPLSNALGHACMWLSERLVELSRHLIRCDTCGRSRYYGTPCVGVGDVLHSEGETDPV